MTDEEKKAESADQKWASPLVEADEYHRLPADVRKEKVEKGIAQEGRFSAGEKRHRKQIMVSAAWGGIINLVITAVCNFYAGLKLIVVVATGLVLGGLIAAFRLNQIASAVLFGLVTIGVVNLLRIRGPLMFFGWLFYICWGALAATWMDTTE